MGRIDDAMRKAADHTAAPVAERYDAATIAAEPFPDEEPGSAEAALVGDPVDDVLIPAASAHTRGSDVPTPTRATAATLFERLDSKLAEKVVVDVNMLPVSREQYRKLAAALHQAQALHDVKVIMVASAVAGEGKTLTASNLALTFSESYQRSVLLIDGDLRRPSLHTLFGIDGSTGLSEGLMSKEAPRLPLHRISPRLTLLPAGRPSHDPMAGLTSERMRQLIEEARGLFDWVIVDTPPVGILPDGHLLSSMVDGALLVVRAGSTPYTLVQRAADALGKDRILGVVLNQATSPGAHAYYSYQYDYRPTTTEIVRP